MGEFINRLVDFIFKQSGRDLSAYSSSFLLKTIDQRIVETATGNFNDYLEYLYKEPKEVEMILQALNISYSLFFRNPLDYAILERFILPELFKQQEIKNDSIRIWSTGCADGQEPYSIMMVANDLSQKQFKSNPVMLFATDISKIALKKAQEGTYFFGSLQNVKLSYLNTYFTKKDQAYFLTEKLKSSVLFSEYDLLNERTTSPPFSIFGGYDIVVCCNLMIYYKPEIQKMILEKLYSSMKYHSYLMVDESEHSIVRSFNGFIQYSTMGNFFVKRAK